LGLGERRGPIAVEYPAHWGREKATYNELGCWVRWCIVQAGEQISRFEKGQLESSAVGLKLIEEQPQILRLTTPKLKDVWGRVSSL